MKKYLVCLPLLWVFVLSSPAAGKSDPEQWGRIMDVAHKFTWYPRENLLDLLERYTLEFGCGLDVYCASMVERMTGGRTFPDGVIDPGAFVSGNPRESYYRLAMGQFSLYLAGGNPVHLTNAQLVMSPLANRISLPRFQFWDCLIRAHAGLIERNREKFMSSVFDIWQNIILKQEAEKLLTDTAFAGDLPYLYENLASLVMQKGVIDAGLTGLDPLSVIILDIKDRLSLGTGYKNWVQAIAERLNGLKSDNCNLNFAVEIVEGVSSRHDFEDATDQKSLETAYANTTKYFVRAANSAKTGKGKSAVLTLRIGFAHYALQRMIDGDAAMADSARFADLPGEAASLTREALELYRSLATPRIQAGDFKKHGFFSEENYIEAMHQLWDAAAKLLVVRSDYRRTKGARGKASNFGLIEKPLTDYLTLFEEYAVRDQAVVPDNAYFLAAYVSGELAGLYRKAASNSSDILINDLAMARQLQSIEIYPLEMYGILYLANQAVQERRINMYLKYACGVASLFRGLNMDTDTISAGSEFSEIPVMIKTVLPDLIDHAPVLVEFLDDPDESGEPLVRKALVMSALLAKTGKKRGQEIAEGLLSAVAGRRFPGPAGNTHVVLRDVLPEDFYDAAESISERDYAATGTKLTYMLYGTISHEVHAFIRKMFYKISYPDHIYPRLMDQSGTWRPIFE